MHANFIDDLIRCVTRVVTPNMALLKEVLVIGGMPDKTQNLQYLSYNRHSSVNNGQTCEFSAVAVINNRRAVQWQLAGYAEKISRWVFSTRWTRNPLDLFLNTLRCDRDVMAVLDRAGSNYTLLGILTQTDLHGSGRTRRHAQTIRPVLAIPGLAGRDLKIIQDFEAANQICKTGPIGLGFYRKTGRQMAGV